MPRFLQTNPQTFNVTTVIIAFLKFFKKFYLFIKKLFFFFFGHHCILKMRKQARILPVQAVNWNLNVDWLQCCVLSLKPHSPSQNVLPLVTVMGVSVPSCSGSEISLWRWPLSLDGCDSGSACNPSSAKAGSCHSEEVN